MYEEEPMDMSSDEGGDYEDCDEDEFQDYPDQNLQQHVDVQGQQQHAGFSVMARGAWNHAVPNFNAGDLEFTNGDVIHVISNDNTGWLYGELNGVMGYFPQSYVIWPDTQYSADSTNGGTEIKSDTVVNDKNAPQEHVRDKEGGHPVEESCNWDEDKAFLIAFHIVLRQKITTCVTHNENSTNFFLNASYNNAPLKKSLSLKNFTPIKSQEDLNFLGDMNFNAGKSYVSYTFDEIKENLRGEFSEAYRDLLVEISDLSNEERRDQLLKSAFKGLSKKKTAADMVKSWKDFLSKNEKNTDENDFKKKHNEELRTLMRWCRKEKAVAQPTLMENIAWILKITSQEYSRASKLFEGASDTKEFSLRVDDCDGSEDDYEKAEFTITAEEIRQQMNCMKDNAEDWMTPQSLTAFGLNEAVNRAQNVAKMLKETSVLSCCFEFMSKDIGPATHDTGRVKPWYVSGVVESAFAAGRDPNFWKDPSRWDKFFGDNTNAMFQRNVTSVCLVKNFEISADANEADKEDGYAQSGRKKKIPEPIFGLKHVNDDSKVWCYKQKDTVAMLGISTKAWNNIDEDVMQTAMSLSSELSRKGCLAIYGSVSQSREELSLVSKGQKLFSYTDLGDIDENPGFSLNPTDAGFLLPKKDGSSYSSGMFPSHLKGAVGGGVESPLCRVYESKSYNYTITKVSSEMSKIWAVTPEKGARLKWEALDKEFRDVELEGVFEIARKRNVKRVLVIRSTLPQREGIRWDPEKSESKSSTMSPKDVFQLDLESYPILKDILNTMSDDDLDLLDELQSDPDVYERYLKRGKITDTLKKIVDMMIQHNKDTEENMGDEDEDDPLYAIDGMVIEDIFSSSKEEIYKQYQFGLAEKKLVREFLKAPENFEKMKKAFFSNTKIRKVMMEHLEAEERKTECLLEKRGPTLDEFCLRYRGTNDKNIVLSYQDLFLLRSKANVKNSIDDMALRKDQSILTSICGFMLEQLKMGVSLESIYMNEYFLQEPLRGSSAQTLLSALMSAIQGFMQSKVISMFGLQDLPMPFCVPVSKNASTFYWWVPLQAYFHYMMQAVPTIVSFGSDIKCGKTMLFNELFQCSFGSSDGCVDHFGIQFLPTCQEFQRGFHLVDIHGPATHYTKLIDLCISIFQLNAWYIAHVSAKKTLKELSNTLKAIRKCGVDVEKQLVWVVRDVSPSLTTDIEKLLQQHQVLPASNTPYQNDNNSIIEEFGVAKSRIFTIVDISNKGDVCQLMMRQLGLRMKHLIGDSKAPRFPYVPGDLKKSDAKHKSIEYYQGIQERLNAVQCDGNVRVDCFTAKELSVTATCQKSLHPVLKKAAEQMKNDTGTSSGDLHSVFLPFSMHEHKIKEIKDKFRGQSTDNYEKRQQNKKELEKELVDLTRSFKLKSVTDFIQKFALLLNNVDKDFDSLNLFAYTTPLVCKPYLDEPEKSLAKLRQEADKVKNESEGLKKTIEGSSTTDDGKSGQSKKVDDIGKLKSQYKDKRSKLKTLRNSISDLDAKIQRSNISVEHCLRELSLARETDCLPKTLSKDDHVAALVALLFKGWPLELVDGDHLNMKVELMSEVFAETERIYIEKLKAGAYQSFLPMNVNSSMESLASEDGTPTARFNPIFVSVIGPQSSGKSTLLNFLFGGSFQVAGGRCTKGLSVSVVPTDTDYYANPIVVLDTEGLLSIERDDHEFDRKMMLFTMATSHVVLINVKGQINTNMSNILGIAVFALDKFKFRRIKPKLIIILRDMSLTNKQEHEELFRGIRKELDVVCKEAKVRLEDVIEFHVEESCFLMPSAFKDDHTTVDDRDGTRNIVTKRPISDMFIKRVKDLRGEILKEARKRSEDDVAAENLTGWIEKSAETWNKIQDYSDLFDIDRVAELRLKADISVYHEKLMKDFTERWDGPNGLFKKINQKFSTNFHFDQYVQEVQQQLDAEKKRLRKIIDDECSTDYYGTKLIDDLIDNVDRQIRSLVLTAKEKGRQLKGEQDIETRIMRCTREMDSWVANKTIELKNQSHSNESSQKIVEKDFDKKFEEKTMDVKRLISDNAPSKSQILNDVEADFKNILEAMAPVDKEFAQKHLDNKKSDIIHSCRQFLMESDRWTDSLKQELEQKVINHTQMPSALSDMKIEWNMATFWNQTLPEWEQLVPRCYKDYIKDGYFQQILQKMSEGPVTQSSSGGIVSAIGGFLKKTVWGDSPQNTRPQDSLLIDRSKQYGQQYYGQNSSVHQHQQNYQHHGHQVQSRQQQNYPANPMTSHGQQIQSRQQVNYDGHQMQLHHQQRGRSPYLQNQYHHRTEDHSRRPPRQSSSKSVSRGSRRTEYSPEYVQVKEGMSKRLIFIAVVVLVEKVCRDVKADVQKLLSVEYATLKPIVKRLAQWIKTYEHGVTNGQGASLQIDIKGQLFSFLDALLVEHKQDLVNKDSMIRETKWMEYGKRQKVKLKRLLKEGFDDIHIAERLGESIQFAIESRENMRLQNELTGEVKIKAATFTDPTELSKLCFATALDDSKLDRMAKKCGKNSSEMLFIYAQQYSEYSRLIFDAEWAEAVEKSKKELSDKSKSKGPLLLKHMRSRTDNLLDMCNKLQRGFWSDQNNQLTFFITKVRELFWEYVVNNNDSKVQTILDEMNRKLQSYRGDYSSEETDNHFAVAYPQPPQTDMSAIFSGVSKSDSEFLNPATFLKYLVGALGKKTISASLGNDLPADLQREKGLLWTNAIGCEECCPYCGAKCTLRSEHMGQHVTKHRIAGFKGCWEKDLKNNKVFLTDICDEEANYNKLWILPDNYQKGLANAEMRQRASMYGTKSGALTIGLLWHNANDLDLHVTCPDGSTLSYKNRKNDCGGELDHDMNASSSLCSATAPYENIFWKENPPMGEYKIQVHLYSKKASECRSEYTVQVTNQPPGTANAKKVELYKGILTEEKQWSPVHKFQPGCTFTEHCEKAAPKWAIGISKLSKEDQAKDKQAQMKVFRRIEGGLKTYYNL